jgi:NADP-dependent 3-hydroxy acid dehydrogenase YdfG
MKNINEKVVLLTGISSGIGKATAKQLLEMGYIVYGTARRVEKMADLKEEL